MTFFLRIFYTLCILLLLPYIFVRLWWKGRKLTPYRQDWAERLGIVPIPKLEGSLWLHAVSVGEAIAAVPLIRKFRLEQPNTPIVITTMTPTGRERVRSAFKEELNQSIFNVYVPYDVPFFIKRLLNHIKPTLFVAMETEIWPNLFNQMQKHQIPIMIANGRLSPKSAKWYQRFGRFMRDLLKAVHVIAAQSPKDAESFVKIGLDEAKVLTTGNIKFDFELNPLHLKEGALLKKQLNAEMVWIAASTHRTEEAIVLEVFSDLKKIFPSLVLLLVPRHPDRFNEVAELCHKSGFKTHRRSEGPLQDSVDIYLGDTMGEMFVFYAASDIAFVGGSFAPIGGHNLLEPAALHLPVLTGPHLFNFAKITELLVNADGVMIVQDKQELTEKLKMLLHSDNRRHLMGERAHGVVLENRGALDKMLQIILRLWHPKPAF